MSTGRLDRRLTPARPDRAAEYLRGEVEAEHFIAGERRTVVTPLAPLRRAPEPEGRLDTEALRGESVLVYEDTVEGWAWVQLMRDGYVGYVPSAALGPPEEPTHRVAVLRSFIYPGPNLKLPIVAALTMGSCVDVGRVVEGYATIKEGYVWAGHLTALDSREPDHVAVAERFIGVPYLWGGKSSLGLDCSGLVQTALAAAGYQAPRDSDMQEDSLGASLSAGEPLRRGDLVFWKGHVGIMRNGLHLLHANANAMLVSSEPLEEARDRIQRNGGGGITAIKRLQPI